MWCAPHRAVTTAGMTAAVAATNEQLVAQFADALCPAVAADVA